MVRRHGTTDTMSGCNCQEGCRRSCQLSVVSCQWGGGDHWRSFNVRRSTFKVRRKKAQCRLKPRKKLSPPALTTDNFSHPAAVGRGSVRRRGFLADPAKTRDPPQNSKSEPFIAGPFADTPTRFPRGSRVVARPPGKPRLRRSFAPPRRCRIGFQPVSGMISISSLIQFAALETVHRSPFTANFDRRLLPH
jgi:hypothetical protein